MAESLSLRTTGTNGTRVVFVGGELDMATASELEDFLADLDGHDLIVDIGGLSFIDSSGFSRLVAAHERLERRGNRLTIRKASPTATRAFAVLGLDQVLHLEADEVS